ncbi:MAG: hypothetical protein EBX36_11730, partial [Planctomycetia bacterium]|nr:hypothetical protein [Planctomycetia bacterium]
MSTSDSIDAAGTANLAFLEELFEQYQHDPASVDPEWRSYFDSLGDGAAVGVPGGAAPPYSGNGRAHGAAPVPPAPVQKLVAPDGIATG